MKPPLETLTTAAGILLMAFLSCLLLPAPALGLTLAQKLVTMFHLMDLSQLYTLLFCLWFLVLGAIEYFVLRFIWRRWFSLASPYFAAYFAYSPSPKGTFMDKQSLHETAKRLALELPFVELCWPFGPEFDVFKIGGKIFMLSSELRGVPFINLKSDPQKSLLNQQIYPSIKPGYHMNKKHWISVYPGEEISEALLRDLINDSWNLVVDGLAKRDQKRVRPG